MPDKATEQTWYLYLIETAKGSLYTGITTDVASRLATHETGKGAKYLRGKGPLTLVAQQAVASRSIASRLEYQVKQLAPEEKLRLLKNDRLFGEFLINSLAD